MPLDQIDRKTHISGASRGTVLFQKTLKSEIGCTGVALHSGAKVSMTLKPADVDTGIVFRRIDIVKGSAEIPALWSNVVDTRLCSVLGNADGVTVSTVEHLMAAFAGIGIDNAVVEINGPEIPIMDGSSAPFLFLMECAGVAEQDLPRRALRILKPVQVGSNGNVAELVPSDGFAIDFEIEFDSAVIARQTVTANMAEGAFKKELARARTFGFMHEVEQLLAAGLAKGGSLENAVVVSGDRVLNEDGLRYSDEFVRHKALDALGDLYLAGGPIIGRFRGSCTGHAANNGLLRALFANKSAWEWCEIREDQLASSAAPFWPTDESVAVAATA